VAPRNVRSPEVEVAADGELQMHPNIRRLIVAACLAIGALTAGSGAALAASDKAAYTGQYTIDVEWCWPSEGSPTYCFTLEGRFASVESTGTALSTGTLRRHTAAYENGEIVSESYVQTAEQWRMTREGSQYVFMIEHSRFISDGQMCTASEILRLADYQVVLEHTQIVCV
jgi:hypothetical protein